MQRLVIDNSEALAGNQWAAGRRDFLIRELFATYFQLQHYCRPLLGSEQEKIATLQSLLGQDGVAGPLAQLPRQACFIWPQEPEHDFTLLSRLLLLQAEKQLATLSMSSLAGQQLVGHELTSEAGQQEADLIALLAQADQLLYDILLSEAGNSLLLRLLLENPQLPVTLWQKDLVDLCNELFPHAPESVFLNAAKSYFNGQWLEEALAAFEQALALNPAQEEARRRSHIVRGMLRDKKSRG